MRQTSRWIIIAPLFGIGLLGGIVVERLRFEVRRDAVVKMYEDALKERNQILIDREIAREHSARLAEDLRQLDTALGSGRLSEATAAWERAYADALGTQRWETMADVGDAALRIAGRQGRSDIFRANARRVYRIAVSRARRAGSLDGVLRLGRGFLHLGDSSGVEQCIAIAEQLAGADRREQARVRDFAWLAGAALGESRAPASSEHESPAASPTIQP